MRRIITLTTDFGYKDYFVGSVKGVILGINPEVILVDITHEVDPYDVGAAAYLIKASYSYFPKGTIHLGVVDPGVGGQRRPILAEVAGNYFVGPDNGIFSYIFHEQGEKLRVIHLTAREYFLKDIGSTFHGRDLFAPVAAWLSKGIDPVKFGEEIQDPVKLELADPIAVGDKAIEGRIIYIDRFGNLITNITQRHLSTLSPHSIENFHVTFKKQRLGLKQFYAEGAKSQPNAVVNSCGHLEIFVYMGNAHKALKASVGDPVLLAV